MNIGQKEIEKKEKIKAMYKDELRQMEKMRQQINELIEALSSMCQQHCIHYKDGWIGDGGLSSNELALETLERMGKAKRFDPESKDLYKII